MISQPETLSARIEAKIRANRLFDFSVDWQDELLFPFFDGYSLYNVSQTILNTLGAEAVQPLRSDVWGDDGPHADVERVILFVSDGLGYRYLSQLMAEDERIAVAVAALTDGRGPVPLTSIAPSTTAVALPTLWSAVPPATHGMLGTLMFLREHGVMGDMLRYSPALGQHQSEAFMRWGHDPAQFIPVPTVSERLAKVGVPTYLLMDKALLGTGLSRILHRGLAEGFRHTGRSDFWLRLEDVLVQTAGQRCYVSVYWPNVDTLSHLYGAHSRYVANEIQEQLTALARVLAHPSVQDGKTLVIILADHGHHDVPDIIALHEDACARPIYDAMRMPMGAETRFSHLYLRNGMQQQVKNTIAAHYADRLVSFDTQMALEAGLFGPGTPSPEANYRLGDLTVVSRLGTRLADPARFGWPISMHGGLSDWEMLVPFMWKRI